MATGGQCDRDSSSGRETARPVSGNGQTLGAVSALDRMPDRLARARANQSGRTEGGLQLIRNHDEHGECKAGAQYGQTE